MKKLPSKVAYNRPPTFFFLYWPGCPNVPKAEIPYPQKSLNARRTGYLDWGCHGAIHICKEGKKCQVNPDSLNFIYKICIKFYRSVKHCWSSFWILALCLCKRSILWVQPQVHGHGSLITTLSQIQTSLSNEPMCLKNKYAFKCF